MANTPTTSPKQRRKRSKWVTVLAYLFGYLLLPALIFVGIYIVYNNNTAHDRAHNRNFAGPIFGNRPAELCENTAQSMETPATEQTSQQQSIVETIPDDAKFIVIDTEYRTLLDDYNNVLPASHRANNKDDLTHVVCLNFDRETYEYKVAQDCVRQQDNIDAFVIDVKTGQMLAVRHFSGGIPELCPTMAGTRTGDINFVRLVGKLPEPQTIRDWLLPSQSSSESTP